MDADHAWTRFLSWLSAVGEGLPADWTTLVYYLRSSDVSTADIVALRHAFRARSLEDPTTHERVMGEVANT